MICPKVFEAADIELQKIIISDMEKKNQAKVELARRFDVNFVDTGAALIVNRSRKKRKKTPYSTKTFVDPRTGNVITGTYIKI